MSFTWPLALLMLAAVPALLGAYFWQLRRKRKNTVRFSNLALVKAAMPTRSRWRRYLPLGLFLAAITSLSVASARPSTAVTVPLSRSTVVLALDVSRSMCATDVDPNRLSAAQDAARAFIEKKEKGARVGIVAFSGSAQLIVAPTTEKKPLIAAIDTLTTGRGTVIGAATLKAIDAIAAINPDVAPTGPAAAGGTATPPAVPAAEQTGKYAPEIVVLLTDGANTRGVTPIDAAQQAVDRKVRVYTIGFGTQSPSAMVCTREQVGGGGFTGDGFPAGGGGGGGGGRSFLVADNETLMKVAEMTGGQFFQAENADQLGKVFAELPSKIELQKEQHEISVVFAIFGALLAAAAVTLSLMWNRFP